VRSPETFSVPLSTANSTLAGTSLWVAVVVIVLQLLSITTLTASISFLGKDRVINMADLSMSSPVHRGQDWLAEASCTAR
jgi:hypothetical protein